MKVDGRGELELLEKLLTMSKKVDWKGTLAEIVEVIKAMDIIQRGVNEFKNPAPPVISEDSKMIGKNVTPLKPKGKK